MGMLHHLKVQELLHIGGAGSQVGHVPLPLLLEILPARGDKALPSFVSPDPPLCLLLLLFLLFASEDCLAGHLLLLPFLLLLVSASFASAWFFMLLTFLFRAAMLLFMLFSCANAGPRSL